jgi:hypothetical protein
MVDQKIMRNHDDISNPAIVRFVAQLFKAAYEQQDLIHEADHQPPKAAPDPAR